jgi:hypothetical protein
MNNICLTDLGAARIIEAACRGGRLKHLKIEGSVLNYHTIAALHERLRTRNGLGLESLALAECGVGGDLDGTPNAALPPAAALAYFRAREILEKHDRAAAEAQRVLDEAVDAAEAAALAAGEDGVHDYSMTIAVAGGKTLADEAAAAKDKPKSRETSKAGSSSAEDRAAEGENTDENSEEVYPLLLPLFGLFAEPNSCLRTLDLSKTSLSEAAAACLARTLRTAPLEVLNLNQCCLGDAGFISISEYLG